MPAGVPQRRHTLSINQLLHNDFFILNREREAHPDHFGTKNVFCDASFAADTSTGASVFNFDDIYERVAAFAQAHKALEQKHPVKLYMCSVDITRSFDTIDQNRCVSYLWFSCGRFSPPFVVFLAL
jgi:hypothetical protein